MNPYNALYPTHTSRVVSIPHSLGELSLVACPLCATLQNIDGPTVCEGCQAVLLPQPGNLADLKIPSEVSGLKLDEYAEDNAIVAMVRQAQGLELAAYQIQSHDTWLETASSLMREALLAAPDIPAPLRVLSGSHPALAAATLSGTLALGALPGLLADPLVDVRRSMYLIGWDEDKQQAALQQTAWIEVTAPPRVLMGHLEEGSTLAYSSGERMMPLFV